MANQFAPVGLVSHTFTARGETFLPERDGARLANQYDVVKAYVLGRDWCSLREISSATGYPEASVSARLRDCRARGYLVERRFITRGLHLYKVSVATPVQLALTDQLSGRG